jgi:Fe2+ transport system protein FeoA
MMLLGRHFKFQRRRGRRRGRRGPAHVHGIAAQVLTLADVPVGWQAKISGFTPCLSAERNAHLQAYGVVPGYWVRVVQHSPVTVIQVEHIELALEDGLARKILVMEPHLPRQG